MAALSAWFWNERFWLPHNVTWADLADPAPGVEYPKAGHLLAALPLALGIFIVRTLFERFVFSNTTCWSESKALQLFCCAFFCPSADDDGLANWWEDQYLCLEVK